MNDLSSIENKANISNKILNNKKSILNIKGQKIAIFITLLAVVIFLVQGLTSLSVSGNEYESENENSSRNTFNSKEESNSLILVNRENKIDENYIPDDLVIPNVKFISEKSPNKMLRKEAALKLENMFMDAKDEGIHLEAVSGYRSYEYQLELYNKKVRKSGKEEADKYVAEAGTSEHQTGFVMDVLSDEYSKLDEGFKDTNAYSWLCNNMHEYGFIIRYPQGKEHITGYEYEPWHLRYVGEDVAKEINYKGITLEEYKK